MIVYTGGTFDMFHAGHVAFLSHCRKLAGRDGQVVVALNTDEFITSYKGKVPICSYGERADVLLACRYVDLVIPNESGADSKPTIGNIMPGVIAIGTDWATKDYYAQMDFTQEWLDKMSITLVYVAHRLSTSVSTTAIKKRVGERS